MGLNIPDFALVTMRCIEMESLEEIDGIFVDAGEWLKGEFGSGVATRSWVPLLGYEVAISGATTLLSSRWGFGREI